MKNINNPLNMAQALAAQRSQQSNNAEKGMSGHLSTEAMQAQLNLAGDTGQSRLGSINRMRARQHESQKSLETSKAVIDFREAKIIKVSCESIDAQITLIQAQLKHRFNTEYAVIGEQGLAAFAQAQSSFYAVVDAGCDLIYEDLHQRVQELTAKYQAGLYSDASYENEMVRAQKKAEAQIKSIEASCAQRIDKLNNAFNG